MSLSSPSLVLPRIVGLSGYARSGKDTVANYLVEHHGYRRVAFADTLKRFVASIYPDIGSRVEAVGWEAAKEQLEVRQALQRVGTLARHHIHPDIWVMPLLPNLSDPDARLVVSDVRFPNEAAFVQNQGGPVIRINRPGVLPAGNDVTDTSLDTFDGFFAVLENDGTLDDLYAKAESAMRSWSEQVVRGG